MKQFDALEESNEDPLLWPAPEAASARLPINKCFIILSLCQRINSRKCTKTCKWACYSPLHCKVWERRSLTLTLFSHCRVYVWLRPIACSLFLLRPTNYLYQYLSIVDNQLHYAKKYTLHIFIFTLTITMHCVQRGQWPTERCPSVKFCYQISLTSVWFLNNLCHKQHKQYECKCFCVVNYIQTSHF